MNPISLSDAYSHVELTISDHGRAIPSKYGSQIKAAGGRYSECRGHTTRRFVTLPAGATAVIDALLKDPEFVCPVIILRNPCEGYLDLRGVPNRDFGRRGDDVVISSKSVAHIRQNNLGVSALVVMVNNGLGDESLAIAEKLVADRAAKQRYREEQTAKREQLKRLSDNAPRLYDALKAALPFIGYEGAGAEEALAAVRAALAEVEDKAEAVGVPA